MDSGTGIVIVIIVILVAIGAAVSSRNQLRELFDPTAYGPIPLHHRTEGAGDSDDEE